MGYDVVFRYGASGWQSRCNSGHNIDRQARTLSAGRADMRRALARVSGCREDEVVLDETIDLPYGWGDLLAEVRAARRRAEEQRRLSVEATREAVIRLAKAAPEMGMRDIAALVGVSYQRVQQLLSDQDRPHGG